MLVSLSRFFCFLVAAPATEYVNHCVHSSMRGCTCPPIGIEKIDEAAILVVLVLGSGVIVWDGLSHTCMFCFVSFLGVLTPRWQCLAVFMEAGVCKRAPYPPLTIFGATR